MAALNAAEVAATRTVSKLRFHTSHRDPRGPKEEAPMPEVWSAFGDGDLRRNVVERRFFGYAASDNARDNVATPTPSTFAETNSIPSADSSSSVTTMCFMLLKSLSAL